MRLPASLGELSYCTNVHPGEDLRAVRRQLIEHVSRVRDLVAPGRSFGVGLRLSGLAAHELDQPQALASFRALLGELDLYVFTVNGFPFGSFHGGPVKEQVYLPDWRSPDRFRYTTQLARILAALLPAHVAYGSISTVPAGFKGVVRSADLSQIGRSLARLTAELAILERSSGRRIVLALEPEPCCVLETTSEAVAFFERHAFGPEACATLASELGIAATAARATLARHLGVCLDLCHAAVEYETLDECLGTFAERGIEIAKVQLSSGLTLDPRSDEARAALEAFRDDVYLHQVIARTDGALVRYVDLPEAERAWSRAPGHEHEWRVHFHVPLFHEQLSSLSTTQSFVRQALTRHRQRPISEHLEVETYTWGVLPPALQALGVDACVARELSWVTKELGL